MSEKWEFSIMQSTKEPLGEGEGEGKLIKKIGERLLG